MVRKLISFDDETYHALIQLGRDRMATMQDLADEAFADVLKKHGVPIDLKDALRKSVKAANRPSPKSASVKSSSQKSSRKSLPGRSRRS